MFVFEDLLILDAKAIQQLLKEVDMKDVGLALKGANEDVKALIFANMSTRASAMLNEDMEFMGPVKRRSVEEAQGRIVAIVRRLEETGKIQIARGGAGAEDELVTEPLGREPHHRPRHRRGYPATGRRAARPAGRAGPGRPRRDDGQGAAGHRAERVPGRRAAPGSRAGRGGARAGRGDRRARPATTATAPATRRAGRRPSARSPTCCSSPSRPSVRCRTPARGCSRRTRTALVELAIQTAEKILQATLQAEPHRVTDVLRGALRKAYVRDRLQVVCNPEDLAMIEGSEDALQAQVGTLRGLELIGDRRVQRGGVIVRTPGGDVDATLASQLERIRAAMLGEDAND